MRRLASHSILEYEAMPEMLTVENLNLIADIVFFGTCIIVFLVMAWAFCGSQVPKTLYSKYPRRLIYMSQLPFTYLWRTRVTEEDMLVLDKSRFRLNLATFAIVILTYAMAFYAHLHTLVLLQRCMMQGL